MIQVNSKTLTDIVTHAGTMYVLIHALPCVINTQIKNWIKINKINKESNEQ